MSTFPINNIASLNLMTSYQNDNAVNSESFSVPGIYRLKARYEDCLLPNDHPWAAQAAKEMEELRLSIENEDFTEHYANHVDYTMTFPRRTFSKEDLPFLIKIDTSSYRTFSKEKKYKNLSIGSSDDSSGDSTLYSELKKQYSEVKNHECIKRVLLASRCTQFLKKENIDRIRIPKKFLIPIDPKNPSNKITYKTHAVLAEKLKIIDSDQNTNSFELWNSLDPSVRIRQKAQTAYVISKLGYTDAHKGNIVLLEDGMFSIIDFDEPFFYCGILFKKLFNRENESDKTGSLRIEEIENSKKGLSKWLRIKRTWNPYDTESNSLLFDRYTSILNKEIDEVNIYNKCNKIMKNKVFKKYNSIDLKENEIRRKNLEERAFFWLKNK
jgi:hypothetical protein